MEKLKTDVEILQESLAKYKDKTGRKAVALADRIRYFEARDELRKDLFDWDNGGAERHFKNSKNKQNEFKPN